MRSGSVAAQPEKYSKFSCIVFPTAGLCIRKLYGTISTFSSRRRGNLYLIFSAANTLLSMQQECMPSLPFTLLKPFRAAYCSWWEWRYICLWDTSCVVLIQFRKLCIVFSQYVLKERRKSSRNYLLNVEFKVSRYYVYGMVTDFLSLANIANLRTPSGKSRSKCAHFQA